MPIALAVAVAGATGALARWGLDSVVERRGGLFPWGIFVVNVTGAFLVGFLQIFNVIGRVDIFWFGTLFFLSYGLSVCLQQFAKTV